MISEPVLLRLLISTYLESHSQFENLSDSLPTYEVFVFIAVNSWNFWTKRIYISRFMELLKKKEVNGMHLHFFHSFSSQLSWKKYQMFRISLQPSKYWKDKQKIYTNTHALEVFNFNL